MNQTWCRQKSRLVSPEHRKGREHVERLSCQGSCVYLKGHWRSISLQVPVATYIVSQTQAPPSLWANIIAVLGFFFLPVVTSLSLGLRGGYGDKCKTEEQRSLVFSSALFRCHHVSGKGHLNELLRAGKRVSQLLKRDKVAFHCPGERCRKMWYLGWVLLICP